MKTIKILATIAISAALAACKPATVSIEPEMSQCYNVAVLLDGTDRLANSNAISQVSPESLTAFAERLAASGTGSLFVSYVDRDSGNNAFALFEIWHERPKEPGEKKEHVMQSVYDQQVKAHEEAVEAYESCLAETVERFSISCRKVVEAAYADEVASAKSGSDVNGAVNKAIRALAANEKSSRSHIILVSDCIDNVGKELAAMSESTELITVNTNPGDFDGIVSKQYVTFEQAADYLF